MAIRLEPIERKIRIAKFSVRAEIHRVELTEVVDLQLRQVFEDRPFFFCGSEHLEIRQWILRVSFHDCGEF
jgi:hypothetical protein